MHLQYGEVRQAHFLERPNRFIAQVELGGRVEVCHVKNTGRCRELLVPGAKVYLEESGNPARKTQYDLIAVEKGTRLINMDAQAPNRVFEEWARGGGFLPELSLLRPETTYRNSRFDFYWESSAELGFVEVKGVTLEEDGVVRFPDAPTLRGVKHLQELEEARRAAIDAVRQLGIDVGIPQKVSDLGVKEEDIDFLADSAMADACTPGNPKTPAQNAVKRFSGSAMPVTGSNRPSRASAPRPQTAPASRLRIPCRWRAAQRSTAMAHTAASRQGQYSVMTHPLPPAVCEAAPGSGTSARRAGRSAGQYKMGPAPP